MGARRLPRFYKDVTVAKAGGGYAVLLDAKPLRTPAKAELILPNAQLAEAVAGEWRAQTARVDPAIMPLTRLANTAIDRMPEGRDAAIAEIAAFAATDALCYRADAPRDLAALQAATWDPLLDWAEARYGARLAATRGLAFVAQPPEALAALARAVAAHDDFALAALHAAVTLLGSLVLALALSDGRLDAGAAYAAAHIDEAYQTSRWGRDEAAYARASGRKSELAAAALVLESLRNSGRS
jgi:chaperone required for assembly of F1-ATPase